MIESENKAAITAARQGFEAAFAEQHRNIRFVSYDSGVFPFNAESYAVETVGDEIFITEQVNNMLFRKIRGEAYAAQ